MSGLPDGLTFGLTVSLVPWDQGLVSWSHGGYIHSRPREMRPMRTNTPEGSTRETETLE